MSANFNCGCTCNPGNMACGEYQGQVLIVTCRSDGACLMPEACAPNHTCEMQGLAVAACVPVGGMDATSNSDGAVGCSEECSQTSMCDAEEQCECPCLTENEYCQTSEEEGSFKIVCNEDKTCFEKIKCEGETVCNDNDETGAFCGPDPTAPVCPAGECVPPPACGEEPEESLCPICPCESGDQLCSVESGVASILTCDNEAQCVSSLACPAGDKCIPTGSGTAQCSSNLTQCEDITQAYTIIATTYTACSDDDDCIYQWGKCDIGFNECYFAINWQHNDLLNEIYQLYQINGCPLSPVCSGCGPEPVDGVCNDGTCEPKYADTPAP